MSYRSVGTFAWDQREPQEIMVRSDGFSDSLLGYNICKAVISGELWLTSWNISISK